jgi:uncharacterized membrane protein
MLVMVPAWNGHRYVIGMDCKRCRGKPSGKEAGGEKCSSWFWGTILIRPYVFVFLIAYVVIGSVQMDWHRMVVFSVIGFLFGFGSEALSQRIGFPYGPYEYLGYATRGKELWALNVPLMASLSFIFMNYAGLLMAMTALGRFDERAPGMRFVDFTATLHMPALLLLAPLFTTVLDIVIDPVALQGKDWFLGELYT